MSTNYTTGSNYNKQKVRCYQEIDRILESKDKTVDISLIYYVISTKYGFGKKILMDRLENLEELGKIKIKEGVVYVN